MVPVDVVIRGRRYRLVGDDPERSRALARKVDETMALVAGDIPTSDGYQHAILTALHIADESLSAQEQLAAYRASVAERVGQIVDDLDSATASLAENAEAEAPPDQPSD